MMHGQKNIKLFDKGLLLISNRGKHARLSFDKYSGLQRAQFDSLSLQLLDVENHNITCIFTFSTDSVDARCVAF